MAGDLLPEFAISTKVGFFPSQGGGEHSLDPDRLLQALEKTNADLGRPPDLVFLHNPERSLTHAGEDATALLADACGALQEAVAKGLCRDWGVASWNPSTLLEPAGCAALLPSVLMVRSGLTVGAPALDAAEALATLWRPKAVWGMSPFGGDVRDPVWEKFDPRLFLQGPGETCSPIQAAFRVAYHLPEVDTVAVGTDDPGHLRELVDALPRKVDSAALHQYRTLLRERSRRQPA